jgi:hypothetical protein
MTREKPASGDERALQRLGLVLAAGLAVGSIVAWTVLATYLVAFGCVSDASAALCRGRHPGDTSYWVVAGLPSYLLAGVAIMAIRRQNWILLGLAWMISGVFVLAWLRIVWG